MSFALAVSARVLRSHVPSRTSAVNSTAKSSKAAPRSFTSRHRYSNAFAATMNAVGMQSGHLWARHRTLTAAAPLHPGLFAFRYNATHTQSEATDHEELEAIRSNAYHCATCNHESKMPIYICNACNAMDPRGGTHGLGASAMHTASAFLGHTAAAKSRKEPSLSFGKATRRCAHHGALPCQICDPVVANACRDFKSLREPPSPEHACDYFQFFECPHKFNMDQAQLKQLTNRYRELQKVLHPDVYTALAGTTAADIKEVQQQSAAIADAYRTLRNPYQRALYLLELHGIDVERLSENQYENLSVASGGKKPDLESLQQQEQAMLFHVMEVRETLEESEDTDEINDILRDATSQIEDCLQAMETAFEKMDLFDARHRTVLLNYLSKIQQEAENKLDSLGSR